MATYKVIQDIEAEDKFVGPLTLKQFIFAMIGGFFGWISFFFFRELPWGMIVTLPIALFGFFMAFPWSKEQPTDVWVLAKIRFYFKPKKRVWDQAGREDLVTITAPKKIEKHLTKDFSETEVKSRLKALAETIDSRGWAVKHATSGEAATAALIPTDRLVDTAILPRQVPDEAYNMPDIMENSKVDHLISQTDDKRRIQLEEKMNRVRQGELYEKESDLISPPEDAAPKAKNTADRIDELLLSDKIKASRAAKNVAYGKLPTIPAPSKSSAKAKPSDDDEDEDKEEKKHKHAAKQKKPKDDEQKSTSTVTEQISPDILNLARNNDLNVATIARQVNAKKPGDSDEVVISLH